MSRIGKKPIEVPEKVKVDIKNGLVSVGGPNGNLSRFIPEGVLLNLEGTNVLVNPVNLDDRFHRAKWGMFRTIVANMVHGVKTGFTKTLEFNGVGYKAAINGQKLVLNLGYSHPIEYSLPPGIAVKVEKNQIHISGADKELVGFVAAKVRSFRPPEPYKGKGIKYLEETIIRKAGKTGSKK